MAAANENEPERGLPDPSNDHKLLLAEGNLLAKVRETARRITERVCKTLGYKPADPPPDANPPALA
jgi:hypothetical protein